MLLIYIIGGISIKVDFNVFIAFFIGLVLKEVHVIDKFEGL